MKKLHILAISLVSLLAFNVSNAFVYQMELWQDDKKNTVITLSDRHVDTFSLRMTRIQKPAIIDLASKLNAYCIFEDSMSYAGTCPEVKENYQEWANSHTTLVECYKKLDELCKETNLDSDKRNPIKKETPLSNITDDARKNGVECENIEFRQPWIALGDKKTPTLNACTELNYKLDEIIEKYKTDEILKEIYSKYSSLNDIPLHVTFTPSKYLTPSKIYKGDVASDRLDHLLELEIISVLYKKLQEGKKMFIVYTGAAHIHHITTYGFKEMGFKQKACIGELIFEKPEKTEDAEDIINNALDIPTTYEKLKEKASSIEKNIFSFFFSSLFSRN